MGDLLVAPTRVVLEGTRRSAEVALVNTGTETATYRISLSHLRMKPDGTVEEFAEAKPEDRVADALVRYSPRQVVLEPGMSQTVRIQLRKPAELDPGEYRSHLLFRALPKVDTSVPTETTATNGVAIRLVPVYGVSIPLIVRHGQTAVTAKLQELQLVSGSSAAEPLALGLVIHRDGNRSVYGNLRVEAVRGGKAVTVGELKGVAVYTPLTSRSVEIALRPPEGMRLNGSRLHVTYRDAERNEDGDELLSEASVDVP